MAARYSRVERKVWRDEKFRKLTPRARMLWLYLLTCDAHGGFPGLFLLRLSSAAEDLSGDGFAWSVEQIRASFAEAEKLEMVRRDEPTGVVWLPNALRKHDRMSVSNAKGWRSAWAELPDCELTRAAFRAAIDALNDEETPGPLVDAFSAKAPSWWVTEGGSRGGRGGHVGAGTPPAGGIELGTGTGTGTGTEAAGEPPAAKPGLAEAVEELSVGRDLYRTAYVSDDSVRATAVRICNAIANEPKASRHSVRDIVRDAVTRARKDKGNRPAMPDEAVLAAAEENATRWILGDIRSGKRVARDVKGASVGDDFDSDEVAKMEQLERETDVGRAKRRGGESTGPALFAVPKLGAA